MEVVSSGHPPVVPCVEAQLSVRHGREAVTFYEAAFRAQTCFRLGGTDELPVVDPFGHHWEIGRPLGPWPPAGGDGKERP
jgi:uncharacterized glyoxalase superfamily protein PhnB